MTTSSTRLVSKACVPVSTTETVTSSPETRLPALDAARLRIMRRLIGALVHQFGWTLGQDGNLYSSNPVETGWGERVN